ncbi:hypothetical protein F5Y09DRAFT_354087 [Xylaria sp. FL1042]|nr:hypothetical protein F5Y09DRAFT_354087 [Xylaria sp. FL1042]
MHCVHITPRLPDIAALSTGLKHSVVVCCQAMAEIIRILSGGAGLLDICTRLTIYIRELKANCAALQQSLDALFTEVVSLDDRTRISFEIVIGRLDLIQSQISTGNLDSNQEALRELKVTIVNEHFHTPQPVSSIYTRREELLEELKDKFIQRSGYPISKLVKRSGDKYLRSRIHSILG